MTKIKIFGFAMAFILTVSYGCEKEQGASQTTGCLPQEIIVHGGDTVNFDPFTDTTRLTYENDILKEIHSFDHRITSSTLEYENGRLSRLGISEDFWSYKRKYNNYEYNDDSTVKRIVTRLQNNTETEVMEFQYENKKPVYIRHSYILGGYHNEYFYNYEAGNVVLATTIRANNFDTAVVSFSFDNSPNCLGYRKNYNLLIDPFFPEDGFSPQSVPDIFSENNIIALKDTVQHSMGYELNMNKYPVKLFYDGRMSTEYRYICK